MADPTPIQALTFSLCCILHALVSVLSLEQMCLLCYRQTFYSSSGSVLAEYASEAELRALVRTFGLYSAREIGACTERPIAEAVSGLLDMLTSNEEPLSRLHTEYKVHVRAHISTYA